MVAMEEDSCKPNLVLNLGSGLYELQRREGRGKEEEVLSSTRKKLRLSKEQTGLLEHSFMSQSTLNPKQKQALAKQLNLLPRQVEVWYQNRRARSKSKQAEAERDLLKQKCDTLREENQRLLKELEEMKEVKSTHVPIPSRRVCPTCEKLGFKGGENNAFTLTKPNFLRERMTKLPCYAL
ncbi:hypothetical protein AMTRI_Chr12g241610 [Amborella trichopoda]